jgi:eukaryotic-like serine/threonine-protein kinase
MGESAPRMATAHAQAVDPEVTGSKITGSRGTGTMSLPVDRKLPVLASACGLLVLLVIMGVVLARRGSAETQAAGAGSSASASASVSREVVTADLPGIAPSAPTGAADPTPAAVVAPAETAQPGEGKPATTGTGGHASIGSHPVARPQAIPTQAPAPRPTVNAAAAAAAKKNCDPPFTYEANGRKKYKLECM